MYLKSWMFWKVREMYFSAMFSVFMVVMSVPSNRILPLVTGYMPVHMLKKVVLPAPFGPMMPKMSPSQICMFTSSTAFRPPKYLHTCCASRSTFPVLASFMLMPPSCRLQQPCA